MKCDSYIELISAYIDGEISEADQKNLENHLLTCKSCQETLTLFYQIKENMSVIEPVTPPKGFHEHLMGKVKEEALAIEKTKTKKKSTHRWMGYVSTAAAVIIGVVFIGEIGIAPLNEQPNQAAMPPQTSTYNLENASIEMEEGEPAPTRSLSDRALEAPSPALLNEEVSSPAVFTSWEVQTNDEVSVLASIEELMKNHTYQVVSQSDGIQIYFDNLSVDEQTFLKNQLSENDYVDEIIEINQIAATQLQIYIKVVKE